MLKEMVIKMCHIFLLITGMGPIIDAGLVNKAIYGGLYPDGHYDDDYYNNEEQYNVYGEGITISPDDYPVIKSKSEHFKIDNGGTINLPCHVEKVPNEIAIMWKKIDDENKTISLIASDHMIIDPNYQDRTTVTVDNTGSTLTIAQSKYGDSGKYQCELGFEKNPPQINHIVTIVPTTLTCRPYYADYWVNAFESSPSVAVAKNFIYKDVGEIVEIVCTVQAVPVPEILWVKDEQVLRSSHRFKISHFGNEHTLTIYPIHKRDFGIYICQARNSHGIGTQMIELKGIDNAEPEEFLVAVGLSPSGHLESLEVFSSRKGLYPIIGEKPISAKHFSIRFIQKTGEGWEEIIVPSSMAASIVPIAFKVLLFCGVLLLILQ